jgi:serine/threonine protein kinase
LPEEVAALLPAGAYTVESVIGRGGMGAVYRGWQKSLDRYVAIKILPPGLARGDADFAARFKREAKAMARLKHPGIIPVHDAGETFETAEGDWDDGGRANRGLLYFVMDFVEGTDVERMIAAQGRLPQEEALSIICRVLDALAYAHQHGIIHRDIKPANIMVDREGHVLVADFGLARSSAHNNTLFTGSHVAMGTPDFMPPEARSGTMDVDQRADLFAVGVMLYQMLTGQLPRGRFAPPSKVVPGLDRRLDGVVDKLLQSDRDRRYSTAIEVKAALEPILVRTLARRPGAPKSPRALTLVAAGVIVFAAIGWFAWKKPRAPALGGPAALGKKSLPELTAPPAASVDVARATKEAPFVNSLGM